jgi:hypothetical protein
MENVMKLDIKAFALTCGIIWGLTLPLLTWWVMATSGSSAPLLWLTHVYRGYSLTLGGSVIGAAWAFFDGLLAGALFAWLYDVIGGRLLTQRHVVG